MKPPSKIDVPTRADLPFWLSPGRALALWVEGHEKAVKKVIGAGAGNPPCIVDETADLVQKPPKDNISGAAFD